jgi:methylamine dehydrogenase accessory protein MauD
MTTFWVVSNMALWAVGFFLGLLLLSALRALALLRWRLDQLEATTPSRIGRSGLKLGKQAPDFTLPCVAGGEVSLHNFVGRKVFLVFTRSGCGPCHQIIPELNKLQGSSALQVLVVNSGDPEASCKWAAEANARFPVLVQEDLTLSKRYEVFATPFAFFIDGRGKIASKGIINNCQHISFVLSGAGNAVKSGQIETESATAEVGVA